MFLSLKVSEEKARMETQLQMTINDNKIWSFGEKGKLKATMLMVEIFPNGEIF